MRRRSRFSFALRIDDRFILATALSLVALAAIAVLLLLRK